MATIKYNGMELEEVTEPQIFDPPQEMLVMDEDSVTPVKKIVAAILATGYCHNVVATDRTFWQSCFRFSDPRRATNRELSRWLAQGNGECRYSFQSCTKTYREYDVCDDNTNVDADIQVRKWSDTEWHEPTVDYLGIET